MEEVKVRGMLDPSAWRGDDSSGSWTFGSFPASDTAFAIDPGFVALNSGTPNLERFPYTSSVPATDTMRRVTLYDTAASQKMGVAVAKRIFETHDELSFLTPDDPAGRPYLAFLDSSGAATISAASAAVSDTAPQTYSWLATVAPAQPSGVVPLGNQKLYAVSVVVFFNRDTSTSSNQRDPEHPGERLVGGRFLGSGIGGGELRLYLPVATASTYLNVLPGNWLLICSKSDGLFSWCRVVAVGDVNQEKLDANGNIDPLGSDYSTRYVTLAGPDWPAAGYNPVSVGLFTDVVTVHTEIVPLK